MGLLSSLVVLSLDPGASDTSYFLKERRTRLNYNLKPQLCFLPQALGKELFRSSCKLHLGERMPWEHWVSLPLFSPFFPSCRSLPTPSHPTPPHPIPATCHPSAQTQEGKDALSPRLVAAHPQPRSLGRLKAGRSEFAGQRPAKKA